MKIWKENLKYNKQLNLLRKNYFKAATNSIYKAAYVKNFIYLAAMGANLSRPLNISDPAAFFAERATRIDDTLETLDQLVRRTATSTSRIEVLEIRLGRQVRELGDSIARSSRGNQTCQGICRCRGTPQTTSPYVTMRANPPTSTITTPPLTRQTQDRQQLIFGQETVPDGLSPEQRATRCTTVGVETYSTPRPILKFREPADRLWGMHLASPRCAARSAFEKR